MKPRATVIEFTPWLDEYTLTQRIVFWVAVCVFFAVWWIEKRIEGRK